MHFDTLSVFMYFAFSAPIWIIAVILVYYQIRRAVWRRGRRRGKSSLGFYPTSFALGMALQFIQVYWRPSVDYELREKQREDADEDDDGDPENLNRQLHRQLKKIRRGEPVDRLVLRI
jgi:branched-subunit amino acid ABC-type transport system permease component